MVVQLGYFKRREIMNNANAPAMPIASEEHANGIVSGHPTAEYTAGLTKREHYAGQAMASWIIHHGTSGGYGFSAKEAARSSVECADALLAALEAKQ
jgi:hypothetical protein